MIKYCIFIIFGIILYLLLNTYNGFSIGVPNSYLVRYYYNRENLRSVIDMEDPYAPEGIIEDDVEADEGTISEGWEGNNEHIDEDPNESFRYYEVVANDEDDALQRVTEYEQQRAGGEQTGGQQTGGATGDEQQRAGGQQTGATGDEQQRAGGEQTSGDTGAAADFQMMDCLTESQIQSVLTGLTDEGPSDSFIQPNQRYIPCPTNSLNRYDAIRLVTLLRTLRNRRINTLSNDDLLFLGYNINQYESNRHWGRYARLIRFEFNSRFSSCASRKRKRE
tara:strand:- start:415 stop:1248 length:834 start_codon:yes stop_codon:yes gene_type:complete